MCIIYTKVGNCFEVSVLNRMYCPIYYIYIKQ